MCGAILLAFVQGIKELLNAGKLFLLHRAGACRFHCIGDPLLLPTACFFCRVALAVLHTQLFRFPLGGALCLRPCGIRFARFACFQFCKGISMFIFADTVFRHIDMR